MPKRHDLSTTLDSVEFLRQKYLVEELNASQIAKLIGCSSMAVGRALERFDIPKRPMSQILLKSPSKPKRKPRQKYKATLHNREWLSERFWKLGLTASEIARLVGCSFEAACQAIRKMFRLKSARRVPIQVELHPLDIIQKNRPLRPPMKVVVLEDEVGMRDEVLGS